jgi:hypothetical protein
MLSLFLMSYREDRAVMHSLETGRGKRVAVLLAALVAVALVLWAVAAGFRGRHLTRNAGAFQRSFETPTQPLR